MNFINNLNYLIAANQIFRPILLIVGHLETKFCLSEIINFCQLKPNSENKTKFLLHKNKIKKQSNLLTFFRIISWTALWVTFRICSFPVKRSTILFILPLLYIEWRTFLFLHASHIQSSVGQEINPYLVLIRFINISPAKIRLRISSLFTLQILFQVLTTK